MIINVSQYFVPQIKCTKNIHNSMLHTTLWIINYQIGLRTHRTIVHPNYMELKLWTPKTLKLHFLSRSGGSFGALKIHFDTKWKCMGLELCTPKTLKLHTLSLGVADLWNGWNLLKWKDFSLVTKILSTTSKNSDVNLEGQVKLNWRVQYNVENMFFKGYKIMYSHVQCN